MIQWTVPPSITVSRWPCVDHTQGWHRRGIVIDERSWGLLYWGPHNLNLIAPSLRDRTALLVGVWVCHRLPRCQYLFHQFRLLRCGTTHPVSSEGVDWSSSRQPRRIVIVFHGETSQQITSEGPAHSSRYTPLLVFVFQDNWGKTKTQILKVKLNETGREIRKLCIIRGSRRSVLSYYVALPRPALKGEPGSSGFSALSKTHISGTPQRWELKTFDQVFDDLILSRGEDQKKRKE